MCLSLPPGCESILQGAAGTIAEVRSFGGSRENQNNAIQSISPRYAKTLGLFGFRNILDPRSARKGPGDAANRAQKVAGGLPADQRMDKGKPPSERDVLYKGIESAIARPL